jgi:hypothetical protein
LCFLVSALSLYEFRTAASLISAANSGFQFSVQMHTQNKSYLVLDHSLGLHEKVSPLTLNLQEIKNNENKENKNETRLSKINTEK